MNIFLSQSLQTQIELEEIADVKRQIITPATSRTVIGIVQDGLLGAYNLTSPTMRIDWRNAMNIMSYTSIDDFATFKKDKEYTGHEMYTMIIPPNINVDKSGVKIKNGVFESGKLTDEFLGAFKKNNLIQLVWDEYGPEETKQFIDNTQRLINNFNLYNGFTVGYDDIAIKEDVTKKINDMIATKEQKVNHMITEIENNPDLMERDVFEFQMFSELNIIREDVSKLIMENLKPDNNFKIMISSGSKGGPTNMGQMSGCVGLQAFEGKLIPMKYNRRTLPYFHENDDRAVSRGLVKQSFTRGMEFPEFVYHMLTGREGLIDQAIKSVSGNTPILLQEDGKMKRVLIGDWIDDHMKNNKESIKRHKEYDQELLNLTNKVYIPTTDNKGKVSWEKITAITRHDPTKAIYEIKTHGGRSVIIADSKSLLIWNETKQEFEGKLTADVKIGDLVPVTWNLSKPPKMEKYINMTKYFPKTEYLYGTDYHLATKMMNNAMDGRQRIQDGWWQKNNGNAFTLPFTRTAMLKRSTGGRSKTDSIKDGYIYSFSKSRDHGLPEKFKLNRNNGIFIGLFLAEGNADIPSGYVQISNKNPAIQKFVNEWFDSLGIKHITGVKKNTHGTSEDTRGYSIPLATFLTKLVGHGSRNKYVPSESFNAPDEFIIGLIDGYFSGDGCITKNSIEVSSSSPQLLEGINILLSRIGIIGRLTETQLESNNLGTIDIAPRYNLSIRGQWAKQFQQKIELTKDVKNDKLEEMTPSNEYKEFKEEKDVVLDRIISIQKVDVTKYKKLYDVTVPKTLNFMVANGLNLVDTAETGYQQRKLIKSMEDIMVKYDSTIRTANDSLLQLTYGDSGADATRQYEYVIKMLKMGDKELSSKHQFTSEELKNLKKFTKKDNDDMYELIRVLRDELRTRLMRCKEDFKVLTNNFMLPVNLNRIIDSNMGKKELVGGEKLQPEYIVAKIVDLLSNEKTSLMCLTTDEKKLKNSVKRRDEEDFKFLFKVSLFDALSPKRCIVEYNLSQKQFDAIIDEIIESYNKNLVEAGEMVGIICAQSMGECLTQMSTLASSRVMIADKNGKINYISIGEFSDRLLDKNDKYVRKVPNHKDSVVLDMTDDYYIVSVDQKEKLHWKKISQISRHPANGNLMRVTTKSGRTTTATLSHSFLKRTIDGIDPIKGSDLKVGDRIPVAKNIKPFSESIKTIEVGDKTYKLDYDLGWLFGVYLADGSINHGTISICKIIQEYCDNISYIVNDKFKLNTKMYDYYGEYGPGRNITFAYKELAQFITENFGTGSYEKKLPSFVFNANKLFMAGIISGYFDSDGNIDVNKSLIRVSSRSKQLINDIASLCSFFDMFGSILEEKTVNQPGKVQYGYCIQRKYAQIFNDQIGLIVNEKRNNLQKLMIQNERDKHCLNNFIDMIPCLGDDIVRIAKLLKLNNKKNHYRGWAKRSAIGRETLGKFIEIFNNTDDSFLNDETQKELHCRIAKLESAYDSDIIWDEISNIEILPDPKEYVYDFTVPSTESFMIDTGILVHNTLNSFHSSGIKSMSSTTQGVPRIKEIMSVSKNPKTPQMMIYLTDEFKTNKEMAQKIASHIKYTTLGDIRGRVNIYYNTNPREKGGHMETDNVKEVFYNHKATKTSCQADINSLPWLMRIELDREKMLEKEVTMLEIKSKFCSWWERRFTEAKTMRKEEKKVINKITSLAILSNTDNDKHPVIHIRFNVKDADKIRDPFDTDTLNNFIDYIVDKFKLKGINSISNIPAINEERMITFNNEDHDIENKTENVIYTAGVNLLDIRYIMGIDPYRTIANDIVETYKTFGIEIARARLMREISTAYERAGKLVNYQHLSILAEIMTYNGYIMSIDRHGMNKSDTDPLSRASFEKTVEQLLIAAVFGERDHMKGISSRIMAGLVIKGGTGYCDIVLDTEMIEKSEYVEENAYIETFNEITSSNIASDIINKEGGEIFIPV